MSLIAYFQAVLPLTLAQLVVPPLSTFELMRRELPPDSVAWLIEPIRSITPKDMLRKEFVHLLLLPSLDYDSFLENPERVLNYRLFTTLFVHYDYHHLLGNIMMLLSYGVPLYQEKGILFFYNVYFTSGFICALPLYSMITQSFERHSNPPPSPIQLVGGLLKEVLKPLQESVPITPNVVNCGSSAAVCGILGGSTVILMKQLSVSLIKIVKNIQESSSDKDMSDLFMHEAVNCCLLSWGLWQAYKVIRAEIRGYERQSRAFSLNFTRLLDPSSWKVTNHEAHIHGFMIGAVMTLLSYS